MCHVKKTDTNEFQKGNLKKTNIKKSKRTFVQLREEDGQYDVLC